jgi:hypothetical protein
MELITEIVDFVEKEVAVVEGDFAKGANALIEVAQHADTILNQAKAWTQSPAGETILGIVEQLPVVGVYAEDIVNTILPDALAAIGVIEKFPTETFTDAEAAVQNGIKAIFGKSTADEITLAFNSVVAFITNKIAPLLKVASTLPAALSVGQAVYASGKSA